MFEMSKYKAACAAKAEKEKEKAADASVKLVDYSSAYAGVTCVHPICVEETCYICGNSDAAATKAHTTTKTRAMCAAKESAELLAIKGTVTVKGTNGDPGESMCIPKECLNGSCEECPCVPTACMSGDKMDPGYVGGSDCSECA